MTLLSEIDGWSPIISSLCKEVGLTAAAVFGRIWSYCQMSNHVCTASMETIADDLGITRNTVLASISLLITNGYIVDQTPDRKGFAHVYADTGKVGLIGKISVSRNGEVPKNLAPESKGGAQNLGRGVHKNLAGGAQNLGTRKLLIDNKEKDTCEKNPSQVDPEIDPLCCQHTPPDEPSYSPIPEKKNLYPLASAISEVTGMDIDLNHNKIFPCAKKLSQSGYTKEQILGWFGSAKIWYGEDWRGLKGDKPGIRAINEKVALYNRGNFEQLVSGKARFYPGDNYPTDPFDYEVE